MQQLSYAETCTVGAGLAAADTAGEFFAGSGAYGAGAAFGEGVMEGAELGAFAGPAGILVGAAVGALVVYAWEKTA
jgi:hypothetical protein